MHFNRKKALATVGAIGALGALGGLGTFAAFTDELPAQTTQFKTGTVKVTGAFTMPDASSLATQEAPRAGSMTFTNTGTEPINVFVDWDGPVGNVKCDGACSASNKTAFSDNPLAENIIVDSSYESDFSHLGDDATRLWKVNDRNLFPLLDEGTLDKLVLQPGQQRTLYFRVHLREQGPNAWGPNADDNVMQASAINEAIHVKAIEAGTSYRGLGDVTAGSDGLPAGWNTDTSPLDGRPDNNDNGQ